MTKVCTHVSDRPTTILATIEGYHEEGVIKWSVADELGTCAFPNNSCTATSIGVLSFDGFNRKTPNYKAVVGGRGFTPFERGRGRAYTFEGTSTGTVPLEIMIDGVGNMTLAEQTMHVAAE